MAQSQTKESNLRSKKFRNGLLHIVLSLMCCHYTILASYEGKTCTDLSPRL